jgi:hypothetical protein
VLFRPATQTTPAEPAANLAEAPADAAFNELEDIGDKILRARTTSAADLAIKARVLALRDHGNGYRYDDVERFRREVQIVAAGIAHPR